MERFWNIIHYFAYRADYKLSLLYIKLSFIVNVIYKLPFSKKRFKKLGINNPVEYLKYGFRRRDFGISVIYSGGLMGVLILFICFGLFIYYQGIIRKMEHLTILLSVLLMIPPFVINHLLLFKKDKYLKYFKQFDKKPRKWKVKWAWISLGVFLGALAFLISSFAFWIYRLNH
ncbi:MAG: hypothetical protein LBM08_13650 [Dysgonamonadaceae bacterium]|nr:hypothetical protein [Dysgonamonadaceae bacterium]